MAYRFFDNINPEAVTIRVDLSAAPQIDGLARIAGAMERAIAEMDLMEDIQKLVIDRLKANLAYVHHRAVAGLNETRVGAGLAPLVAADTLPERSMPSTPTQEPMQTEAPKEASEQPAQLDQPGAPYRAGNGKKRGNVTSPP